MIQFEPLAAMQTRTAYLDVNTPRKRKFAESTTLLPVAVVTSKVGREIELLEGLLHILLQIPHDPDPGCQDDGNIVLDKIGSLRIDKELGAVQFGARWSCGEYTNEWFDDHVMSAHDDPGLWKMLLRCALRFCLLLFVCCRLLMDDLEIRRVSERLVEDVLNAEATKRFVSLLLRSKVKSGPRQGGDNPTDRLSIKQFIPEKVFKRWLYNDVAGCNIVWPTSGAHRQWKPAFGEPGTDKVVGPDCFKFTFLTVCSWSPCFRWQDLVVESRYEGFIHVPFSEGVVVTEPQNPSAVHERLIDFEDGTGSPLGPGKHWVRMQTHGQRAHNLPLEGLHGVVAAKRWTGQEYELLMVLEDVWWVFWVSESCVEVHNQTSAYYKRRFYGEKNWKATGKRSAETLSIRFKQVSTYMGLLRLAMDEASEFRTCM